MYNPRLLEACIYLETARYTVYSFGTGASEKMTTTKATSSHQSVIMCRTRRDLLLADAVFSRVLVFFTAPLDPGDFARASQYYVLLPALKTRCIEQHHLHTTVTLKPVTARLEECMRPTWRQTRKRVDPTTPPLCVTMCTCFTEVARVYSTSVR